MSAPLELRLTPRKPRTLAGEGIVLDIAHTVSAGLDMETVELNRHRTALRITPLAGGGSAFTLSGADHVALHHVHPLSEVGRRFHAPAGSAWTSSLHLLQYARPLEARRYRMELAYRYGDAPEESAVTNAVEVEVVPGTLLSAESRWFGGSGAREQLGTLWAARRDQETRWMFQIAGGRDPGAILSALDLELAAVPRGQPRLALLNDIAALHYDRYVVWVDGERLGYLKTSDEQRLSDPAFASHGLQGQPQLADPPLQRRGGGMCALLAGTAAGQTQFAMVEADEQGKSRSRVVAAAGAVRGAPVVIWSQQDEKPAGSIFFLMEDRLSIACVDLATGTSRNLTAPGEVFSLAADQWLERGTLLAFIRREERLEVIGWESGRLDAGPRVLSGYDLAPLRAVLAGRVAGAAVLADPPDLAVLFPSRDGWAILSRGITYQAPAAKDAATPSLVGTPGGLFLVEYLSNRGFAAARLGEAPPPDLV